MLLWYPALNTGLSPRAQNYSDTSSKYGHAFPCRGKSAEDSVDKVPEELSGKPFPVYAANLHVYGILNY